MSHGRVIVNVAFGSRNKLLYPTAQARLLRSLRAAGNHDGDVRFDDKLSIHSPPHDQVPYAFKQAAMGDAVTAGHRVLLWLDAVIVALKPVEEVFRQIEDQGYLLWSHPQAQWSVGQWTSDACLTHYGISRDQALNMESVCSAVFGYSLDHTRGAELHRQFIEAPAIAMRGSKHNRNKTVSKDRRVQGHRHDQSVLGILMHKLGLHPSPTPYPAAPHGLIDERTVFVCDPSGMRGW